MLLRTPLFDRHAALGARLVDFAGWEMPVVYTSTIEEHTAVRSAAGMFDVSHMGRLSFSGPDVLALLQRVWTNNAATMKEFQTRYGLICNEDGGVKDDVLVYRWPTGWAMVVNASNRPKIAAWLMQQREGLSVQMEDRTPATVMIAVQGPKALGLCNGLVAADLEALSYYHAAATQYKGQGCLVSRTGYTGEDGVEFMVAAEVGVTLWDELLARGVKPCGLGARDTLRLEAGMPLYGHEITEGLDPLHAGLGWAVKFDKGDFIGRAALERRRQEDRPLRVGLELAGKRIAREGARVISGGQDVGVVTSGTFAPTLQKTVAMAYLAAPLTAVGTECSVDVRGKPEAARVVPLPFYKRPRRG